MATRSEPRFKTDTPASIQVIRDKSRTIDCRITDVSGVGFQIFLSEPLQQGEFIRILVEHKCVICVVRRCEADDSGFTLGLERVDEWAAGGEWNDQAPAANPAAVKNPVGDLRSAAMHNLFGYREVLGRHISPRTFSLMLSTSALLAIVSVGIAVRPRTHAVAASQNQEASKSQPTPAETVPVKATDPVADTADVKAVDNSAPASTSPAPIVASTNTKESAAPAAALNPVPAAKSQTTAPTMTVAVNKIPASPVSTAPPQPTSTGGSMSPAGSPAWQSLQIVASDMSWVAACADGKKVFENVMTAGAKTEVHFSQEAVVRSGNAGALAVTMGSKHLDAIGQRGMKLWLKASPTSLEVVSVPVPGACAAK